VEYIQALQVPVSCEKYVYAWNLVFLPVPRASGCFHSVRRRGGRAGLAGANTVAYDCSAQVIVKSSHVKQRQGMFCRPVWALPEASLHGVSVTEMFMLHVDVHEKGARAHVTSWCSARPGGSFLPPAVFLPLFAASSWQTCA